MNETDLLSKLGQFGPGFMVAAYVYFQARKDRDRVDELTIAERLAERAREKEHMQLMVDMTARLLETVNANTRAITAFEGTQSSLARAIESLNQRQQEDN